MLIRIEEYICLSVGVEDNIAALLLCTIILKQFTKDRNLQELSLEFQRVDNDQYSIFQI